MDTRADAAGRPVLTGGLAGRLAARRGGVALTVVAGVPGPEGAVGDAEADAVADGSTAALITGMPGPTPAFLTTTFAPSQATLTAMAVPAIQAASPTMSRHISVIMPQATP